MATEATASGSKAGFSGIPPRLSFGRDEFEPSLKGDGPTLNEEYASGDLASFEDAAAVVLSGP
jgi:hypothetical protein